MSRRLNTIETRNTAEADTKSSLLGENTYETQPFAFSKNVLNRE